MPKFSYIKVTSVIATFVMAISLTAMFVLNIYVSAFEKEEEKFKPYIFLSWWGILVAGLLYITVIVALAVVFGLWVGSHFEDDDDEYSEYEDDETGEEYAEEETQIYADDEGAELPL